VIAALPRLRPLRHGEGMTSTATPQPPGISLAGLTKTFLSPQGPVHAVRDLDLAIDPGQTVALLGPNGADKSTTVDLLLGLLPPDRGTVSLFGATPAEAIAAGAVGAMLQTGSLIRWCPTPTCSSWTSRRWRWTSRAAAGSG
jgi:ABC-2 type transport system ATP-binding protein